MGELRDRMVQDMRVRNLSVRTIESYVAAVRGLAKYYRKAPDTLSDDEVHRYLIHVREERKLSGSSCQLIRCGLRFLYEVTLQQPHVCLKVPPGTPAPEAPGDPESRGGQQYHRSHAHVARTTDGDARLRGRTPRQ